MTWPAYAYGVEMLVRPAALNPVKRIQGGGRRGQEIAPLEVTGTKKCAHFELLIRLPHSCEHHPASPSSLPKSDNEKTKHKQKQQRTGQQASSQMHLL